MQNQLRLNQHSLVRLERTLSGATTQNHSGLGGDSNEGFLSFPKAPALLEPQNQIV